MASLLAELYLMVSFEFRQKNNGSGFRAVLAHFRLQHNISFSMVHIAPFFGEGVGAQLGIQNGRMVMEMVITAT